MVDPASPHHARPHPIRHLSRSLLSPHSYGSVLILIAITYGLSTVATERVGTVGGAVRSRSSRCGSRSGSPTLAGRCSGSPMACWCSRSSSPSRPCSATTASWCRPRSSSWRRSCTSSLRCRSCGTSCSSPRSIRRRCSARSMPTCWWACSSPTPIRRSARSRPGRSSRAASTARWRNRCSSASRRLTTTGYGNLVPAANPGQTFAVMEMLIGQLFLVTAVAKVINLWRPARWRAGQADGEAGEPPATGAGS